jgi:aerobic-type carbon monoxide dehydrogenase small subunit (CoxS/CutS family)
MVLHVNGVMREVTVDPDVSLLTVLRDYLDLTGSKYGCGEGACGACMVLINDNLPFMYNTGWQCHQQGNCHHRRT